MSENIFFKKKGPFELKKLFKGNNSFDQNLLIQDFKILQNANKVIIDTKQGSGVVPYLPLPEIEKRKKVKDLAVKINLVYSKSRFIFQDLKIMSK